MVKHYDLVICDSKNIEKYIQDSYKKYKSKIVYIVYDVETRKSEVIMISNCYKEKGLSAKSYLIAA